MSNAAEQIRAAVAGLRRLTPVAVVAANLFPIASVLLFGWDAGILLLLYWGENLVTGAFTVIKLAMTCLARGRLGAVMGAVMVPFFILHYGLFCFVHGVFVVVIGGMGGEGRLVGAPSAFALFDLVSELVKSEPGFGWSLAAIAGLHGYSFIVDWLLPGRFRKVEPTAQMAEPYGRIVVLHLTLIFGAVPVALMGSPVWALVVLAALKTALDLGLIASPLKEGQTQLDGAKATLEALRARFRQTRR